MFYRGVQEEDRPRYVSISIELVMIYLPDPVRKAQRSSGSRCHIVTFDWVEDCLLGPKNSKRLLKERAYTLDRTLHNLTKGIKVNKADLRKRFDENARIAHELSTSSTYPDDLALPVSIS